MPLTSMLPVSKKQATFCVHYANNHNILSPHINKSNSKVFNSMIGKLTGNGTKKETDEEKQCQFDKDLVELKTRCNVSYYFIYVDFTSLLNTYLLL